MCAVSSFLVCAWISGNGASFLMAQAKYGYSVGLVHNARSLVCSALYSLMSQYIKWPSADDRKRLCEGKKTILFQVGILCC